jgi:hypothetical protein
MVSDRQGEDHSDFITSPSSFRTTPRSPAPVSRFIVGVSRDQCFAGDGHLVQAHPKGTDEFCVSMWQYIFGDYLIHHRVDAVRMSGRWEKADFAELGVTIAWMRARGIDVILFGPVIEFDVPLPRLLTISLRDAKPAMIDAHSSAEPLQTDKKLAEEARNQWKVRYISAYENSVHDLWTGRGRPCPAQAPGAPCTRHRAFRCSSIATTSRRRARYSSRGRCEI